MSRLWKKILYPLLLVLLAGGTPLFAAEPATVRGTVVNTQGNVIAGAQVTLTNTMTEKSFSATTGQDGSYSITVPNPDGSMLTIVKDGFATYSQALDLHSGQMLDVDAKLEVQKASQTVTVHAATPGLTPAPTQQQVFDTAQSVRVIDRQQMDMAGPVAGGAQVLSTAPGAIVTGYGNTGATKYTITVNGLNQGWGGYGGYTGGASLQITLDGIPIVDPATSLWPSATIPENGLIQNVNVTYGPGAAADRWYDNVGGAVEFTPLQPSAQRQANVTATYGSYQQKDLVASYSPGMFKGWSTELAGGAGKGDDFRKASDGFKNPSKDWAAQAKAVKAFDASSAEFGGYYSYAGGYRSQVIPIVANPYITIDGQTGSQQYSQKTSGYYSTLPYASYNKYDTNQLGLIYARQNVTLDPTTSLQNTAWYMNIIRTHDRYNDVYQDLSGANGNQQQDEHNNPFSHTMGDKILLTKNLPWNAITGGGYYLHELYNSRNNFYGPAWGGSKTTVNQGGKIRSSYFDQTDFALFLQDDIHPIAAVHITPGIRYVGFASSFYNAVQQDFNLAAGATLSSTCRYGNFGGTKGTVNVQDACPSARENRSGVEPSIDASVQVRPWLNVYGGFQEALRGPALGGGGGLFQAVDPSSYHLERNYYSQGGFKIHTAGEGYRNNFIFGANYYYEKFDNQEIDTTLANGNTYDADGSSHYKGVNIFADDDPIHNLHLFANANIEAASYDSYVTGGLFVNGVATCNPPSGPVAGCLDFAGYPVSYVPTSTFNLGAAYLIQAAPKLALQPTAALQFVGSQHVFDNCAEQAGVCTSPAPSKSVTMPSYTTLNLGLKVPYKHWDVSVAALNVFNQEYNIFEYISAGSYFNTSSTAPANQPQYAYDYVTAYPGAPITAYVSVSAHF